MSQENPLQRAHALSAQASLLLRPGSSSPQTLSEALGAYKEAAELFEKSANGVGDEGAKKTLGLLTTQHRKLAKDVERRLASQPRTAAAPSRRIVSEIMPSPAVGTRAWTDPASRSTPPFALRPLPQQTSLAPPLPQPLPPDPMPLSPLASSSSSSSAQEESFIHFGAPPNTTDPFSRFWGKLETMLDDISNPVAFASVPLNPPLPPVSTEPKRPRRDRAKRDKDRQQSPSPTESFYLVSNDKDQALLMSGKTPEELALENQSLRASLDALAVHAHRVEKMNAELLGKAEERDKMMRSVVLGVRQEAQKAKQGQDLMRSQLLASSPKNVARFPSGGSGILNPPEPDGSVPGTLGKACPGHQVLTASGLRKKVREMEEEIKGLRVESEKQFEKLKTQARAKKEAKLAASPKAGLGAMDASI
ncbi:hypothetical protein P7C73_g5315, partial [Tremellales sp. Uapishka_1]